MKTSYFAKYKDSDGVSISKKTPEWFEFKIESRLNPTWDMISGFRTGDMNRETFERKYREEILAQLNPHEIYETYKDSVLLCWEKIGEFCHRRIVASWIEEETGHEVEEYGIWKD